MTNYEKDKEKIDTILNSNRDIAIDIETNEITICASIACIRCLFSSNNNNNGSTSCYRTTIKWLVSEYKEPEVDWTKVPIDTPVLASMDGGKWYNFYFAGIDDFGNAYVYASGRTSWSSKTAYDSETVKVPYIKLAEVSDEESK